MKTRLCFVSRRFGRLTFFLTGLLAAALLPNRVDAHPMPNSALLLTVQPDRIDAEIQIPLVELQAAWGHAVNDSSARLVERLGAQLRAYLTQHIRPETADGRAWTVSIEALSVQEIQNPINGTYRELMAQVRLIPPAGASVRRFVFRYDVVLHQVVTHKILVSVRQDWERGLLAEDSPVQVGVIELDIVNNRILPLTVSLETSSVWTGFWAMILLGIRHISEGTDHLLFLLVLLLPAPLLATRNPGQPTGWGGFGGTRYSLLRLLRIVTAFTLGHSLTLMLGAWGVVCWPAQPIEVLIALSIFVSAVHAVRPLFPGREGWVAGGFGLIHGLAFAGTLANLRLDAGPLVLSILGFNLGIEAMQLLIVTLTIPWLLLLSQTRFYTPFRIGGAVLAGIAAVVWAVERISG
jgi:hypothetical protein